MLITLNQEFPLLLILDLKNAYIYTIANLSSLRNTGGLNNHPERLTSTKIAVNINDLNSRYSCSYFGQNTEEIKAQKDNRIPSKNIIPEWLNITPIYYVDAIIKIDIAIETRELNNRLVLLDYYLVDDGDLKERFFSQEYREKAEKYKLLTRLFVPIQLSTLDISTLAFPLLVVTKRNNDSLNVENKEEQLNYTLLDKTNDSLRTKVITILPTDISSALPMDIFLFQLFLGVWAGEDDYEDDWYYEGYNSSYPYPDIFGNKQSDLSKFNIKLLRCIELKAQTFVINYYADVLSTTYSLLKTRVLSSFTKEEFDEDVTRYQDEHKYISEANSMMLTSENFLRFVYMSEEKPTTARFQEKVDESGITIVPQQEDFLRHFDVACFYLEDVNKRECCYKTFYKNRYGICTTFNMWYIHYDELIFERSYNFPSLQLDYYAYAMNKEKCFFAEGILFHEEMKSNYFMSILFFSQNYRLEKVTIPLHKHEYVYMAFREEREESSIDYINLPELKKKIERLRELAYQRKHSSQKPYETIYDYVRRLVENNSVYPVTYRAARLSGCCESGTDDFLNLVKLKANRKKLNNAYTLNEDKFRCTITLGMLYRLSKHNQSRVFDVIKFVLHNRLGYAKPKEHFTKEEAKLLLTDATNYIALDRRVELPLPKILRQKRLQEIVDRIEEENEEEETAIVDLLELDCIPDSYYVEEEEMERDSLLSESEENEEYVENYNEDD